MPLIVRHIENRVRASLALREIVPLGEMVQPEEVTNLVAFLAAETGNKMTAQAIRICGGSTQALTHFPACADPGIRTRAAARTEFGGRFRTKPFR